MSAGTWTPDPAGKNGEQYDFLKPVPCARCSNCANSVPSVTVVRSPERVVSMPVFPETVPVRVKSGHFTGFSGIAPGRKSAGCILRDQRLE